MLTLFSVFNIFKVFKYGLTGVFLFLDSLVFWLLGLSFSLFDKLAQARIFTEDQFLEIAQKFYVVIGVVTLFYVTYALLKALINPDDINKNAGKVAVNLITSLVLLGIVPLLFSYAFSIQNAIISDNIIGNLVLNVTTNNPEAADSISSSGSTITFSILEAFVNVSNPSSVVGDEDIARDDNYTWERFQSDVKENPSAFWNLVAFAEPISDGEDITYIPIVSTLCAGFLIYVVISFCIDLGVRMAKLAFYQIIAPIPILLRIIPEKKSQFDNWIKGTIATFIEVFTRLFIICIIVYLVNLLFHVNYGDLLGEVGIFGIVLIVLGLFAFAKQAPKMLSNVMGIDNGNIQLGIGGKLKGSGFLGNAILGAGQRIRGSLSGGAGSLWYNAVNGNGISGKAFLWGAVNGWRGKGKQFKRQGQTYYNDVLDGKGKAGFFGGRAFMDPRMDQIRKNLGLANENNAKARMSNTENSEQFQSTYNTIKARESLENNEKYTQLHQEYMQQQSEFDREKNQKLSRIDNTLDELKKHFEEQKSNQLKSLNLQMEKAKRDNNITKMSEIQKEIDRVSSETTTEEITNLTQQRTVKAAETFHNESLENEMAKYTTVNEDQILADTRRAIEKVNSKYKANRELVQRRAVNKAVKEWRDANPEEAAIQESMMRNAFKDMKGAPGMGGPKPMDKPKGEPEKK